jgi:hypothetical protein
MVVGTRVTVRVGRCQAYQGQPEKVVFFCARDNNWRVVHIICTRTLYKDRVI